MKSTEIPVILAGLILATAGPPACADGGALRFSAVHGGYRVSVFTAPSPFRSGPVDISVLVLDRATGEPVPEARVSVRLAQPDRPPLARAATFEAATNKLLRAAQFELPASGLWEMQVQVDGPFGSAAIGGQVEAAAALPPWQDLWLWIGWPALAILLFAVHQVRVGQRLRRRTVLPRVLSAATMRFGE